MFFMRFIVNLKLSFILCSIKTLRSLKKVTSSIAKEDINDQAQMTQKNCLDWCPCSLFYEVLKKTYFVVWLYKNGSNRGGKT